MLKTLKTKLKLKKVNYREIKSSCYLKVGF